MSESKRKTAGIAAWPQDERFERAVSGDHSKFKTTIQHKTWTAEEVAEEMYRRLKSIDMESADAKDPKDRTSYAKKFPLAKCE